jgi:hypothetical protein
MPTDGDDGQIAAFDLQADIEADRQIQCVGSPEEMTANDLIERHATVEPIRAAECHRSPFFLHPR